MTRVEIGLVSDTHGLVRPEALAALAGVDRILHAGDIGGPVARGGARADIPDVLRAFAAVAPVEAVRGNNDHGPFSNHLPERLDVVAAGVRILVLHDRGALGAGGLDEGVRVVVAGHSHQPLVEERGAVLHVNPGSAGPRRFKLPIAVARMTIVDGAVHVRIIEL